MAGDPYPKMPTNAWTILRAKAASAPTTRFTAEVVAILMGMANAESAQGNTVRPLRRLGLIDEEGLLTDRGNKWRVDSTYGDACQEILDEIYPSELSVLTDDDGSPDPGQVKSWFRQKGFGDSNARQMARTYVMVASKKVPELPVSDSGKATKEVPAGRKPSAKQPQPKESKAPQEVGAPEPPTPPARSNGAPTVHLDIQIHIPADATPEQIDQIFSSMARHLYAR